MHIGLFGGIGPGATDFYYRRLMSAFAVEKRQFELTVVHVHTPAYLENVANRRVADQLALYMRLAKRLADAGAECMAIPSAAGHFCIEEFKQVSPVPVIDMLPEIQRFIRDRNYRKLGILGTRAAMETHVFGGVASAECVLPTGQQLAEVHQAYVEMAVSGIATEAHRAIFKRAAQTLLDKGAEAIVMGGTDLVLAFDEKTAGFPIVDCAAIHADAIASAALSG